MNTPRRILIGFVLTLVVFASATSTADAHTGFESSDPTDGAVLDAPVEVITLTFTGPAEPTGDGFELLDPNGTIRAPADATTEDGLVWMVRFEPPIVGGTAGFRWTVKAPDAHPIEGSFSFTAPAAAPADEPAAPLAPPSVPPDEPATSLAPRSVSADPALDAFLAVEGDVAPTARRAGAVGRALGLAGTLVGVGALIFALAVLRGDPRDVQYVLFWVRRAGLLAVGGATVELVAQIAVEAGGRVDAALSPSTLGSVVFSWFGIAVLLRAGGGFALATGAQHRIAEAAAVADPVLAINERVGVGAGARLGGRGHAAPPADWGATPREPFQHDGDHAWAPSSDSAGALLGAAALLAAFSFDGHTVTEGNHLITALVDLVHVFGGSVWAGGVMMLAALLWRRRRQGRNLRALQLAVRFSVVATLALVAMGVAGVLLTVTILDSPSELWSTEWGRLLVAKVFFVGVAAVAGAYNHKVLIPEMLRHPADAHLSSRFRAIVSGEAAALAAVIVLTALLMGAAS